MTKRADSRCIVTVHLETALDTADVESVTRSLNDTLFDRGSETSCLVLDWVVAPDPAPRIVPWSTEQSEGGDAAIVAAATGTPGPVRSPESAERNESYRKRVVAGAKKEWKDDDEAENPDIRIPDDARLDDIGGGDGEIWVQAWVRVTNTPDISGDL